MALTNPNSLINVAKLDYFRKKALVYEDVYIGAGASSAAVMVAANHHDDVSKGRPITLTNASGYLWVILPSVYSPTVLMGGLEVQMSLDSTTTVSEVTYKIWKSKNSYSGTFNVLLV